MKFQVPHRFFEWIVCRTSFKRASRFVRGLWFMFACMTSWCWMDDGV